MTDHPQADMDSPLLTTKTQAPPLAPDLVARPRLLDRLNAGLRPDVRLTLISAPPGFGKTTLVQQWLQTLERPTAWFSLDAGDNDLVRFVNYLAASLNQIGLDITFPVQVYPGTRIALQPEVLLAGLLNEISAGHQPFVLVLDDYHSIQSQPVHDALAFLIERQPANMHLIITTRTEPPLPLARLRARRQVIEFLSSDLRLTPQETVTLLQSLTGLDLSEEEVAAIEQLTEGWVASLHLAALSLHGRQDVSSFLQALHGDDRYLLDYLSEEILNQQPAEVQTFLLQTSVLEQFSPSLCDYLLAESLPPSVQSANDLLQHLERSNLFLIPIDDRRRWYRYHRLFGDFLRKRLGQGMRHIVPALHRRAAGWYENNGWMSQAIHHALAGQDYDYAARLIQTAWAAFFVRAEVATLIDWLSRIPDPFVSRHPQLLIIRGWANLLLFNDLEVIEESISRAQRSLDESNTPNRQHLNGSIEALSAFLAFLSGDLQTSIERSHQALRDLSPDDDMLRGMVLFNLGNSLGQDSQIRSAVEVFKEAIPLNRKADNLFIAIWAIHSQSMALIESGRLKDAERQLHYAIELATMPDGRPIPAACKGHSGLADIHIQRHRLTEAEYHARETVRLGHLTGLAGLEMEGHLLLWIALLFQEKQDDAWQHLQHAETLVATIGYQETVHQVRRLKAEITLRLGDIQGAEMALEQLYELETISRLELEARALLELDIRLAKATANPSLEDLEEIISHYKELIFDAGQNGLVLRRMGLQISLAQALEINGKRIMAIEVLENALSEAAPEGMVHVFYGRAVIPTLLRQIAEKGNNRVFARRVMAELWGDAPLPPSTSAENLPEPLSERELEVLRWMARGLSGPEIAEQLTVAPSTVKSHTKNIFQKLNAHSRYEAVEKARKLKII
jgi:LuxR family transcriptional regulator, maltose regulon positive regulatory protein